MVELEDCWIDDDKGGQSRGCVGMQMTIFDHHFVTITRIILVALHPSRLTSCPDFPGQGFKQRKLCHPFVSNRGPFLFFSIFIC